VFVPAKKLPFFKPGKNLKESLENAGKKSEKDK
jgi:nucleoid DNA-binding protein